MVAPDDDFQARRDPRDDRAFIVFAEPAHAARALLEDRRLSLALRCLAATVFGFAFLWPGISEGVVIRLFATYAVVDGLVVLSAGGWNSPHRLAWPLLLGGCVDIVGAGVVYWWLWSGMTTAVLGGIAMYWAIGSGIAYTLACLTLRESDTEHLFLVGGIASLVLGRALLSQLATDPIVLSTWMGLYALTMAILFLRLTLKHYRVILL